VCFLSVGVLAGALLLVSDALLVLLLAAGVVETAPAGGLRICHGSALDSAEGLFAATWKLADFPSLVTALDTVEELEVRGLTMLFVDEVEYLPVPLLAVMGLAPPDWLT